MPERPAHLKTRYRHDLTPRQREVLELMAHGCTNFEIAQRLGLSLDGVKYHVSTILAKLEVDSREEAVSWWNSTGGVLGRARYFRALALGSLATRLGLTAAVLVAACAAVALAVVLWMVLRDGDQPSAGADSPPFTEPLPVSGGEPYTYRPELAYVDDAGVVWLVDADGGNRRRLMDGCTGHPGGKREDIIHSGLLWSPAGEWLACWRDDGSVLVARVDGSAQGQPFGPGECQWPGPSFPAGALGVACVVSAGLEVRNPGGQVEARIRGAFGYAWLPDGGAITHSGPGGAGWLVHDATGNQRLALAEAFVGNPSEVAVTADGRTIAYPAYGLLVRDVATGAFRQFRDGPLADIEWGSSVGVRWALDDRAVLLHPQSRLLLVDPNTGAAASIPDGVDYPREWLSDPRLAPDQRLLVTSFHRGEQNTVGLIDLETGALAEVPGSSFERHPFNAPAVRYVWSGDSSRFCWLALPETLFDAGNSACVDSATREVHPIVPPVQYVADELSVETSGFALQALSPDLRKVAYTTPGLDDPTAPQTLHVANIDGTGEVTLGPAVGVLAIAWRPDGIIRP